MSEITSAKAMSLGLWTCYECKAIPRECVCANRAVYYRKGDTKFENPLRRENGKFFLE